jgi:hypothetical protein
MSCSGKISNDAATLSNFAPDCSDFRSGSDTLSVSLFMVFPEPRRPMLPPPGGRVDAVVRHDLSAQHLFWVGQLPPPLRLERQEFERLWSLHPEDYNEIKVAAGGLQPLLHAAQPGGNSRNTRPCRAMAFHRCLRRRCFNCHLSAIFPKEEGSSSFTAASQAAQSS